MRDKKSKKQAETDEQQALEQKVDLMMSKELPDTGPSPEEPPKEKILKIISTKPANDPKTAPKLSAKLLKTIDTDTISKLAVPPAKTPAETPSAPPDPPLKIIKPAVADEPEPAPEPKPQLPRDPLQDQETDQAVDDIVANEGDTQLAVEDAVRQQQAEAAAPDRPGLIRSFFSSPWAWLFIIGVAGVAYAWFH